MITTEKLTHFFNSTIQYLRYVKQRMSHDRIKVNAGYMAYITLLSLVPLITVLFSAFARFPSFEGVGEKIQQFVFNNFVPTAGEAIKSSLDSFVANTSQMTSVGAAVLFVTAILLISTIDTNLNYIWRVKQKRRLVYSFSLYWMVLTLGPLLMGTSIAVSSHVTSLNILSHETVNSFYTNLPMLFSFLSFLGLYQLVPNIKVNILHSLFGAAVTTMLFEVSKSAFAYYMQLFPSYHLIYGALAAVPILFIWVYLCWLIVLVGAELTASLGEKEQWYDASYQFKLPKLENLTLANKNKGQNSDSSDPTSE